MKSKIILIFVSLLITSGLYAQDLNDIYKLKNYKEIKKEYKNNNEKYKHSNKKDMEEFNRWEAYWRTRVDSSGSLDKLPAVLNKITDREIVPLKTMVTSNLVFEQIGVKTRVRT